MERESAFIKYLKMNMKMTTRSITLATLSLTSGLRHRTNIYHRGSNKVRSFLSVRGGALENNHNEGTVIKNSIRSFSFDKASSKSSTEYVTLAQPAPGTPFHYAFPVHDLDLAKKFYSDVLGCVEGRSSEKWQDYSLHGHQIVAHWVGNDYRCQDFYNPVDGDEVPVPHTGLALTEEEFHALAKRVRDAGIDFIIEPHLRFKGMPGEQWTMFFKDPSGNNLEFKAMTKMENLFAKYNVVD